jgi:uncharacterized repeat protein (TIGR01451 family)
MLRFVWRSKLGAAATVIVVVLASLAATTATGAISPRTLFSTTSNDTCGYDPTAAPKPGGGTVQFDENSVTRAIGFFGTGLAGHVGVFANDESGLLIGAGGTPSSSVGSTIGTLASPIAHTATVTSIPVGSPGLSVAISSGDSIVLGTAPNSTTFTASAASAKGATTISVNSKAAGHDFTAGANIADTNASLIYGEAVPPTFGTGVDFESRAVAPQLYLTDITSSSSANGGDYEQGGTSANAGPPTFADALYGSWSPTVGTKPVNKNDWTLGPHADPIPSKDAFGGTTISFNEHYSAEVVWNVQNLKAFDPTTSTYVALQPGHTYRAQSITHDTDQNHTSGGGDVGEVCTTFSVPGVPAVHVTKTADASSVNAGDPIGFTVTVSNTGSGDAHNVTVTDNLPAGTGTGVTWAIDGSTGNPSSFSLGGSPGNQTLSLAGQPVTLAKGASLTVHITAQTSKTECSAYDNTASISSTDGGTDHQEADITCNAASIQVTKVADAASVNSGDPIGYTVTVKNNGTGTAHGVTLTDSLPAGSGSGVTWAIDGSTGNPASFSLTGAKGSQSLTLAGQPISLAAGASLTVHITAQTSKTECTSYDNTAAVTTTNDGSSQAEALITCNPASIQVTKVADAASVNAGDTIGYTVTVKNNGTGTAHGVTLTDALPAGTGTGVTWGIDNSTGNPASFSLTGSTGSQSLTLAGQPIDLAAGASLTVHITAQTSKTECTSYDNTASVSTTNDGSGQAEALITCNPASIQVTKVADAASVNAGDTIGYTVTVKNNGTGTAQGVTMTDALPAGTGTGVTWAIDGSVGNPGAFSLTGAKGSQSLTLAGQPISLTAGASLTVHITAATSAGECTSYDNTASATTSNDGSSQAEALITCNPASIQVLKTADAGSVNAGDTIGYTVTVKNNGTGTAKGVTLNDSLPAGSGTGVTWTVDGSVGNPASFSLTGAAGSQSLTLAGQPISLAAGASLSVHITAVTSSSECTSYDNTASVSTTNDGTSQAEALITCNPASIQVLKTADAASVNAGDPIGFTVTVKNNGTGTAKGVTLTDALPAGTGTGVTWAIDGSTGNPSSFSLTGSKGSQQLTLAGQPISLTAGASLSVHITAVTSAGECTSYDNTASVTTTNDGSGQAEALITCNPASIQVTKVADASDVNAGDTIGYTVTVKNNGTGTAKGVTLNDSLPAGSGTGVTWAIDGSTGNPASFSLTGSKGFQTLTLAGQPISLAAGASLTVHITAGTSAGECSTYDNTASVSTTNDGTSQAEALITCHPGSVQVLKTADAASVNAGDPIGFTVTVKNNGTGTLQGVTLTDALPAGTGSGVTWAIDGSVGNPGSFSLTGAKGSQSLTLAGQPISLVAGASLSVHITAATSAGECTSYDNTASVTTSNDGSSQAEALITCNPASIQVTKVADAASVDAGDTIGYTVTVKNNGTGTAKGVTLTDALPAGTGTGVTWAIDGSTGNPASFSLTGSKGSQSLTLAGQPISLAAGATLTVHITAATSATECTSYDNTASVTTTNDGSGQAEALITCNPASIQVLKTADAGSVNAGDTIGFTVTVKNNGTGTAKGITLTDPLPAGTGSGVTWAVDGSVGNPASFSLTGVKGSQSLTLVPSTLVAGASLSVHITAATSAGECTSYDNTASVSTSNDGSGQAEALITCNPAAIQIFKTADATSVNAGDQIGYTVTVKNNGTGTAHGVTLTDSLPAGSGSGVTWAIDGSTGDPASFSLTGSKGSQSLTLAGQPISLTAGDSLTVHITAQTSAGECTSYDNTASVSTTNDGSGQAEALINCKPAKITVTKTADATSVDAGDPIGYTVTVKNTGTGTAEGVTLTDPLPAGSGSGVTWAIDGSTGDPGSFSLTGAQGSQQLTLAGQPISLGAGDSLTVHITAATSATECTSYDNTASVSATNDGSGQAEALINCKPADVTVTKTADAAQVNAGDPIGFTVTISNSGTGTAAGVTLNDPLPAGSGSGVTWAIDDSTGDPASFSLTGSTGSQSLTLAGQPISLAAGASLSVHITAVTSATECTSYDNTATVTTTNAANPDPASASIACTGSTIELQKVWEGGTSTTTLSIGTDQGTHDVAQKTVTANDTTGAQSVVPGMYFVSETDVSGFTSSLSCVNAAANNEPAQVFAGGGVSVNGGDQIVCTFTNSKNPPPPPPPSTPITDLSITKTGSPNPVTTGNQITWTMVVTNNGPTADTGVSLSDPLPAGTTFVSVSTTQGTCGATSTTIMCSIGDMAVGAQVTVTLVTTAQVAGTITNTGTVAGNLPETTLANNTASASVVANAFVPPVVKPTLVCSAITPSPRLLYVGRNMTLTLHVKQKGKAAKGVRIHIVGPGLNIKTKPSNKKGIVTVKIHPKKAGIVRLTPVLPAKACAAARIGITNVFTPPVTG